jgi:hypothetical protein
MAKKEVEVTLTKVEEFYIQNNHNMTPEELADVLQKPVEVVAKFHSTLKEVRETQAQKIIRMQGVHHGGATIMTPALSDITDKTRLKNPPKVTNRTRPIKEE